MSKISPASSQNELNTPINTYKVYPLERRVRAVEVTFRDINNEATSKNTFEKLKQRNVRVWVNTLSVSHSANYTDKRALVDPKKVWGELIDRGVSIIQTDEPKALLDYLRINDLHE